MANPNNFTPLTNTSCVDYSAFPDLLTATEAASILRCSERNIALKCAAGTFRACKAGKGWRVNRDDVLRYAHLV